MRRIRQSLRNVELRVIAELLKNSRRSDRELALEMGVSQPTVSRIIRKLEKEGYIQEYTIIPRFSKLGFHLLGLIFIKINEALSHEQLEKVRETTRQSLNLSRFGIVMLERGMGLDYDGVIVCFYRDYSEYMQHRKEISKYPFVQLSQLEGFFIDLDDPIRYRRLTFSILSDYILGASEEKRKE